MLLRRLLLENAVGQLHALRGRVVVEDRHRAQHRHPHHGREREPANHDRLQQEGPERLALLGLDALLHPVVETRRRLTIFIRVDANRVKQRRRILKQRQFGHGFGVLGHRKRPIACQRTLLPAKGQTPMTHSAVAKPATNSTMQLAQTSSGVRPVATIRHNLAEPKTNRSDAPVTINYLEGFQRSA